MEDRQTRLAARKGSLQDVVALYYFVQKLPRLLQVLQAHEEAAEAAREERGQRSKAAWGAF